MSIIIGIDPGKHTGFAKYDTDKKRLIRVEEMLIHQAMNAIETFTGFYDLVVFEDARLRSWFGAKGKEALQGAGSIKRDSTIWEDFLQDRKIPFAGLSPKAKGEKVNTDQFKMITGWEGRTNEHTRDAAMLVYGWTDAMIQSHLRNYNARVKVS